MLSRGKQRLAVGVRENVIQIEVKLPHSTHAIAAGAVDGNDGLGAQLKLVGDIDKEAELRSRYPRGPSPLKSKRSPTRRPK